MNVSAGANRFVLRRIALAFGTGLLLGLVTSGGIASERATGGAPLVALVANAAATLAALIAVAITMHRASHAFPITRPIAILVPHVLGAIAGIVTVHLVLHRSIEAMPWLSERPAQFMNDAVAVAGLLALVWACAYGLDARVLVMAFIGITLYRATASVWHLDHAPGGYQLQVQQVVVAQFVAAALALGLFRTALPPTDSDARH